MIKRFMVAVPVAIALALSACAPFVSTSGEGAIQIFFGTPTGARALSDPPFAQLPVFSGITIKVSGPGMDPVEFTVSPSQTSFTAMVPGGSNRRVELYAPVDWVTTSTLFPALASLTPTLVKAYGATTTIDVVPGQRVTAVLRLEVAETKILLPDISPDPIHYYSIYFADGLSDPGPYAGSILGNTSSSDFEFDRAGRLFVLLGGASPTINLSINGTTTGIIPLTGITGDSFGMDRRHDKLYVLSNTGYSLSVVDLSGGSIFATPVDLGSTGYWYENGSVAVDADGYVYVPGGTEAAVGPTNGIMRIDASNPASPRVLKLEGYEQLGLGYYAASTFYQLPIKDMSIVDGMLYVLLSNAGTDYRGKVVQIDIATLTKVREMGWSSAAPISNPATQFYGPQRFLAIKPRSLVFADEGYDNADMDRLIEVNLDSWTIAGIKAGGTINFFNQYSY